MKSAMRCALMVSLVTSCIAKAAEEPEQSVSAEVGAWQNEAWGDYPGHVNHQRTKRFLSLDSGAERYTLLYSYCSDASHTAGVETPEGYIGMPGPSATNWYHNGFLALVVNGQDVGRTKPSACRRPEEGKRGSLQIVWDRDDAQIRATFLMLPGDPTLYFEAAVFPKATFQPLKLQLVAYPAAYTSQGDRWVVTPSQAVQQVSKADLTPDKDWWVVCEDRKCIKGTDSFVGGCGLLFLPEEIGAGRIEVTAYPVATELTAKAGVTRVHLALWDFHNKTNPEAEAFIKANAERVAATLRKIDFSCRHLRPEAWKAERGSFVEMLPFCKDKPQLAETVQALVTDLDNGQAQLAAATAAGKPSDPALEDRLIEDLEKLEPLLWELRLAKLFAE